MQLTLEEIYDYTCGIVVGLLELHKKGVLHKNINPLTVYLFE